MVKYMHQIASSECWEALRHSPTAYLVDVRTPEEWQETGVADLSSINKDIKLITWIFFTPYIHPNNKFLDELNAAIEDKKTDLFFMCKSGGRSLQAAQAAIKNGYINCYNVNDGFVGNMFDDNLNQLKLNGWLNSNLPRRKL